jgi:hypothetical protein
MEQQKQRVFTCIGGRNEIEDTRYMGGFEKSYQGILADVIGLLLWLGNARPEH